MAQPRFTMRDLQRRTCQVAVRHFLESLQQDAFPMEESEGVFGAVMENQIGKLVYGSWQAMYLLEMCDPAEMEEALFLGSMPAFFESKVRAIESVALAKGTGQGYYASALIQSDMFKSIPWDFKMLNALAGKAMLEEVRNTGGAKAL